WGIWYGPRGSIFSLAYSPDPQARRVAIAGHGIRTGSVVVLDRETGKVEQALTDTHGNGQPLRALAISPSGDQLALGSEEGGIWIWNLRSGTKNDIRLIRAPKAGTFNRVRLLTFTREDLLVSASQDGLALEWQLGTPRATPRQLFRFQVPTLYR